MKQFIIVLFLLVAFCSQAGAQSKGYQYRVKIKGLQTGDTCFLANYYGNKQYLADTAIIDGKGWLTYEGKEPLPAGLYLVVLPSKTYFEFVINEPQFSLETDTLNFVTAMKVIGSEENRIFYEFLKFSGSRQGQMQELGKVYPRYREEGKTDSMDYVQRTYTALEKEVNDYKEKIYKEHPDKLITKIFIAMKDPEIPEPTPGPDGKIDSTFKYRFYKDNYFKYMSLEDERLLRSPVFHNKLNYFFTKVLPQIPDTLIKEADRVIQMTNGNKETFKYVVFYLTNTYETSEIMGMDAVFVHMANTYYKTGRAYWVDTTQVRKIGERADILGPLLIGKVAPNLTLPDTLNKPQTLHAINKPHTILVFWDPKCGHCKTTIPKLYALYDSLLKHGHAVETYSVCIEPDEKTLNDFIRENKLTWINVHVLEPKWENYQKFYDANGLDYIKNKYLVDQLNLRIGYDIYSTPVIYLLDEKKQILAKKLDVEGLRELLKYRYEQGFK
jgi:thiol-disulfide isomerase/thioredoxin